MNKLTRIGILGFGTVGAGVVEGLLKNGSLIADRTGIDLQIAAIADLDIETDRGVKVPEGVLTTDAWAVVRDPDIPVIVELIGGTRIAKELTMEALSLGKAVITANKAMLAHYGREIFEKARENKAGVYFEASVAGGIPVMLAHREGLVGNNIEAVYGILNGTCNYILTKMEEEGREFDDVLKEAQKLGFAEAEPSLDIDGFDTAHKAVLLAAQSFGALPEFDSVPVKGIRHIRKEEIESARELGYRIKLLGVLKRRNNGAEVQVKPCLVPRSHLLSSVSGVFNAVMVDGDIVGETMYYGQGAGRMPTGSAVISDIVQAAQDQHYGNVVGTASVKRMLTRETLELCPGDEISGRYYVRLPMLDQPGSMAKVLDIFGKNNISVASVLQKEQKRGHYQPVIIITHKALEREFQAAFKAISKLEVIGGELTILSIEDMEGGAG